MTKIEDNWLWKTRKINTIGLFDFRVRKNCNEWKNLKTYCWNFMYKMFYNDLDPARRWRWKWVRNRSWNISFVPMFLAFSISEKSAENQQYTTFHCRYVFTGTSTFDWGTDRRKQSGTHKQKSFLKTRKVGTEGNLGNSGHFEFQWIEQNHTWYRMPSSTLKFVDQGINRIKHSRVLGEVRLKNKKRKLNFVFWLFRCLGFPVYWTNCQFSMLYGVLPTGNYGFRKYLKKPFCYV